MFTTQWILRVADQPTTSITHQFTRHIVGQKPTAQGQHGASIKGCHTVNEPIRNERSNTPTQRLTNRQTRDDAIPHRHCGHSVKLHALSGTKPQHDAFKLTLLLAQISPAAAGETPARRRPA